MTEGAAVLPVTGAQSLSEGEEWRAVAEGSAVLVSWSEEQTTAVGPAATWGPALSASSGLARQLTAVVERAGGHLVGVGRSTLFRVELPAGQALNQLVPAVGGGFRGMVRGSRGITNHARLVPVGGAAAGTAVALGPLVGLMALSVAADMIARQQQDRQLEAIRRAVEAVERHQQQQIEATLRTADEALRAASAALLDRIEVPQAVGFGSAVTQLQMVKNQALGWLSAWERDVAAIGVNDVGAPLGTVLAALGREDPGGVEGFPMRVSVLYRALVLDSQAKVLGQTEAALSNPDVDLRHFDEHLASSLAANAESLRRLCSVMFAFAAVPITVGLPARKSTHTQAAHTMRMLARMAASLADAPTPPSLLSATGRPVLEVQRDGQGAWRVREALPEA